MRTAVRSRIDECMQRANSPVLRCCDEEAGFLVNLYKTIIQEVSGFAPDIDPP